MKRTYPQIIMLNYAAHRGYENARIKAEAKHGGSAKSSADDKDPFLEEFGMRLSELREGHPTLYQQYLMNWSF